MKKENTEEKTSLADSWSAYPKIWNIGHPAVDDLFKGEVFIEEKVDGCFADVTMVHMADGSQRKISDLVKNKVTDSVRCFDLEKKEYTQSPIRNWFSYPRNHKKLLRVVLNGRGISSRSSFRCSNDHLIFTQRGWVEASRLSSSDFVLIPDDRLSFLQEQMLIGTLLGDGCMTRNLKKENARYVLCHSENKHDYHEMVVQILGKLFARFDKRPGGYPGSGIIERLHSKNSYMFNEIHESFYRKGKKDPDCKFIEAHLTPISLAFWYMDDGSCNFGDKQLPRPTLHTEGFSEKTCQELSVVLKKTLGISCNVNVYDKGSILRINAKSGPKFFNLIAPYISDCYKYKLPPELRKIPCALNYAQEKIDDKFFIMHPVKGIEQSEPVRLFDIETDCHNYLVSSMGVLVHNSQLSFGRFGDQIRIRSKGQEFDIEAPQKMFQRAAEVVKELAPRLQDGWTYRGEYLNKPKHNTLAYERIPKKNIILFDISIGRDRFETNRLLKEQEAENLGLEIVPQFKGNVKSADELFALLETTSILGGQKIEGVVVKNYNRFGQDGHALMGKFVSERFREVHSGDWKKRHPSQKNIVSQLIDEYRCEARWEKAVNYLRDRGELDCSPKDIGPLLKRIHNDIEEECKEEILAKIWSKFRKDFLRGVVERFPQWYKEKLVEGQFLK